MKFVSYALKCILIGSFMASAAASEVDCLSSAMFGEARGESVEGAILVGNTAVTRHNRGESICSVIKTGKYVPKPVPKNLKPAFDMLARGLINGAIPDLAKGADSFNVGVKPAQKSGVITRHLGHHVFFKSKKPKKIKKVSRGVK